MTEGRIMISQLKWAWSLTKGHGLHLFVFFLMELIGIASALLFIVWSKRTIDLAMDSATTGYRHAMYVAVSYLLLGLLVRGYAAWLSERTKMSMLIELQNALVKSQMSAAWHFARNWHSGDMHVRINEDAGEVVQMVGGTFLSYLLTGIRLVASFGLLWSMDPMLAWLILAISPLLIFSKFYFRKLRSLNRQLKKAQSDLGHVIQENLRFGMLVRALSLQRIRWNKMEKNQQDIYGIRSSLLNFSTLSQGIMKWTINGGFLLTFIWGVNRLHTGQISFGTMTAFLQLVGRIQTPMFMLMSFPPLFVRFRTATERVQQMLGVEQEEDVPQEHLSGLKGISLRQLGFRYADRYVVENLDAELCPGRPVAVVGSSGTGKTTLMRLLLALIKPDKGEIVWKTGQGDVHLSNRHRINLAYVPQGDKLFSGTVRENLLVEESKGFEERAKVALYLACAEFVYDLPEGLDTVIGELGFGFSEGQAQRIALARSLMRDCPVWLFDEVTSALDTSTAKEVIRRILQAGKEKILVFVTHDQKLADLCDQKIYV